MAQTRALVRQAQKNIDLLLAEYLNDIYDGYDEPMEEHDAVEYVYSQMFDLKTNGGGTTFYATGICDELKFLGTDMLIDLIRNADDFGEVTYKN